MSLISHHQIYTSPVYPESSRHYKQATGVTVGRQMSLIGHLHHISGTTADSIITLDYQQLYTDGMKEPLSMGCVSALTQVLLPADLTVDLE